MSISTSCSNPTSTHAPPATCTQPVPITATVAVSTANDADQQADDEKERKSGAVIKIEGSAIEEDIQQQEQQQQQQQQAKRRKEDDGTNDKKLEATTSSLKCDATNDNTTSSKSKFVPSIVRLNSIEKPQGSVKQPFIVTGHIVEHRPSLARDSAKGTTGLNNALSCQKIGFTTSNNSPIMSLAKNTSNNNLWKLSGNHVLKLESPSNILSKTNNLSSSSSAALKKAPLSRPDLVASSISALHAGNHQNQAKTKPPLLISHNQHPHHSNHGQQQFGCNQLFASTSVAQQAAEQSNKNIKFDPSKTIATTLSSQLILSSIITASNSGFKAQQLANGTSLNGLQFCLSAAPTHSSDVVAPHSVSSTQSIGCSGDLISTPTLSTNVNLSKPISPAFVASVNRKTTGSSSPTSSSSGGGGGGGGSSSAKTKTSKPVLQNAQSPDKSDGANGNAAAARLLDLGKRLLEATKEGNIPLVRELVVDSGAPFTSDWLDTTALHIAAQNGSLEIAEILVQGGINKDAQTKLKRTALHFAAQSGSLEVADLLIRNGSEVNSLDMLKMTPLHWAVERAHIGVVKRLLMANADFNIKSKFQLTPPDIAKNSGFFDIMEVFKNWTSGRSNEDKNVNLNAYRDLETSLNESQDFLDIDYHLALVDNATNSQEDPMLDATGEACLDLEFEWNKFDFASELFMPSNNKDDEQNVGYLMKIVEELQKENQQLRQKVEQLSTTDQ